MNDRGLSLTSTDMLKGYLLANITDVDHRTKASEIWKRQIGKLQEVEKTRMRTASKGGCAASTPKPSANASAVRLLRILTLSAPRSTQMGKRSRSRAQAEQQLRLCPFHRQRLRIPYTAVRAAPQGCRLADAGLVCVHYNAQNNFTLRYPRGCAVTAATGRKATPTLSERCSKRVPMLPPAMARRSGVRWSVETRRSRRCLATGDDGKVS